MVISVAKAHLRVCLLVREALADAARHAQVKRRAFHRHQPPRRNTTGVGHRRDGVGVYADDMIDNGRMVRPGEVKVGVIGQVQGRILIARRLIGNRQCVVLAEAIGDLHVQRAGVSFLPVRAGPVQHQRVAFRLRLPDIGVKAPPSAVQMVFAVVPGERIGFPAQRKGGPGDAVGKPAYDFAHVSSPGQQGFQRRISQEHIAETAFAVRHTHGQPAAAQRRNLRARARCILQRIAVYALSAIGHLAHPFTPYHVRSPFLTSLRARPRFPRGLPRRALRRPNRSGPCR